MTDSIETQGKTVKEAVSEGLLKMGARENEVKVTVLVQPKAGLFGFLGGKPAKVLIEKKSPRGKGGRRPSKNDDHAGHGFGVSNDGNRGRGNSSRRRTSGQSPEKQDNRRKRGDGPREDRKENVGTSSTSSTSGRRGGRGRGGAQVKGSQQDAPQNNRSKSQDQRPKEQNAPRQESRENNSRRSNPKTNRNGSNDNRGGRNMNRNRYQHNDNDMVLDKNNPHLDEQRKHFEAAERVRREEENSAKSLENRAHENGTTGQDRTDGDNSRSSQNTRNNNNRSGGRSRDRDHGNSRNEGRGRQQTNRSSHQNPRTETRQTPPAHQEPQVPDEILVQGLSAIKFGEALQGVAIEEANTTLEKVSMDLFAKAGFPCRCEIVDDEYSLVKIVTDDASAGMLIGRHGSTVDAIEHLVERMTCNAVGERVRMNLDINNYRHRREETLVERVADAVKTVLSSGRPYHIEPQDARERRMVHMEALKTEGLRTYTMYGSGGKHVVIAIDDKAKEAASTDDTLSDDVEENPTP